MNARILDLWAEMAELAAVKVEAIGWLPLNDGAYLHVVLGDRDEG